MSRNGSGTYTLPAGTAVSAGGTIESSWANTAFNDLEAELTDSLSRSGNGGMSAPLKLANGSEAAPAIAFTTAAGHGFYYVSATEWRGTAAGTAVTRHVSAASNMDSFQVYDTTASAWRTLGTKVAQDTLADRVTVNEGDMTAAEGRLTVNEADIDTNTASIGTNDTDITAIQGRLTANEADIDTLEAASSSVMVVTTGTWDPTAWTGWTVDPTAVFRWTKFAPSVTDAVGYVVMTIDSGSAKATSTSSDFTLTGLPSAITPTSFNADAVVTAVNNNSMCLAKMFVDANNNQLVFSLSDAVGGSAGEVQWDSFWTTSGTKGIESVSFIYACD